MKYSPAYLGLYQSGELQQRAEAAWQQLACCRLCPRGCEVNRLAGETGVCKTGPQAVVASFAPHFGEEAPLVGRHGSGTIFFSHCNLLCVFCQNYEISHLGEGQAVSSGQLAAVMLSLQQQGCHNINFVTPSHVVPHILAALPPAVASGLTVPLVYNTSGYDTVETLQLLDGVIDIYMPDFKFWEAASAKRYARAKDYPERTRAAIKEMHRQVGDLVLDDQDMAVKGLLVRHLVMPGGLAETEKIMEFLAREISASTYVNVMDQYRPCGQARRFFPEIARPTSHEEYQQALNHAINAGLLRLDQRNWPSILERLGLI